MTQHTPGPWTLQSLTMYEGGEENTGWEVVGANGDTICDNQTYYPHAVSLPDARLIAAAPELLEALRETLTNIAQLAPLWESQGRSSEPWESNVRAAIAKATE